MFHNPDDDNIRRLLRTARRIAVVGASLKAGRPSRNVGQFLLDRGYEIIPVNPAYAGQEFAPGLPVRASLDDVPGRIDIVDIFRRSDEAHAVVDDAIRLGAGAIWMQEGVIDENAAAHAQAAGLTVVMDRCPAKEIPRLGL